MNIQPKDLPPPVNHVFVDFENVPKVDLAIIGARTVHLTVLLGPRQKKIDAALVEKLLENAANVEFVRLQSSGRNALDFTLAYYLGRAALADPSGCFHIVSKDAGYDPLIEHLRSKRIHALRHDDFTGLPFSTPSQTLALAPSPISLPAAVRPKPASVPKPQYPLASLAEEWENRVVEHFRKPTVTRPRTRTKLLSFLVAYHGRKMTEGEASNMIENLGQAGHLFIDAKDKVTYHFP